MCSYYLIWTKSILSYKVKFGFTENFEQRLKTGYEAYYGERV